MRPIDMGDRPLPPPAACRGSEEGANCGACPFAVNGHPRKPVFGEGPETPRWIVVGEGPGGSELAFRRPFVGSSGALLEKVLASANTTRSDVWLANTTLCIIERNGIPSATAEEKAAAAIACSERLRRELADMPPVPILALGAQATKILLPDALKERVTGTTVVATMPGADVAVVGTESTKPVHVPAIIARGLKLFEQFGEDFSHRDKKKLAKKRKPKAPKRTKTRTLKGTRPKKKGFSFTDIVGTLHTATFAGHEQSVIPAIHPAAILRAGGAGRSIPGAHTPDLAIWNLIYDARKVDAMSRGKDIRLADNVEYEVRDKARALKLLRDMLDEVRSEGSCAIDLETYVKDAQRHTALMMYVAEIRCIGIATGSRSICVFWDLLGPYGEALIRELLLDEKVTKGFHHGVYDRTVFRAHGFELSDNWYDTLYAHHCAFPGMPHKLQYVGTQFFGLNPWKSEYRDSEETAEQLALYCARDTRVTAALRPALEIMVRKTATERAYEMDRNMAEIAGRMHLWGVPIDRDVNESLLTTFKTNCDEAIAEINAVANDAKNFERVKHYIAIEAAHTKRKNEPEDYRARLAIRADNIQKQVDAGKWTWSVDKSVHLVGLLRALGVPMFQQTKTGRTATGKAILEELVDVPIVRKIITYRENSKLLSTFCFRMFDRETSKGLKPGFTDANSRAHPSWSVHKISSRWASSAPGMSNVPKDDKRKGRPNLRAQVVAPKGKKLVGFDFSQLEARGIALVSGDEWLCRVFREGRDIHTEAACLVWPQFMSLEAKIKKLLRDGIKRMEYGAFYGGSLETLYRTILKEDQSVKFADVAGAVNKLMKGMPGVVQWQHDCVRLASTGAKEIRSYVLGRRRAFPLQADRNEAINIGIQTLGAEIMNIGMWRMWQRLPKYNWTAFPILQVHDAAVFEVDENDCEEVKQDIVDCFTQEYGGIPFPVEVEIADSWADC